MAASRGSVARRHRGRQLGQALQRRRIVRRRRAAPAAARPAPPACRGRACGPRGPHGLAAQLLQAPAWSPASAAGAAAAAPGWPGAASRTARRSRDVAAGRAAPLERSRSAGQRLRSPSCTRLLLLASACRPADRAGSPVPLVRRFPPDSPLARDLPLLAADCRKFLSHLLPPRSAVIRFLRLLALLHPASPPRCRPAPRSASRTSPTSRACARTS